MTPSQAGQQTAHLRSGAAMAALATACAVGVTLMVALGATHWIGKPFPGFLILKNRVIASIGLPTWASAGVGNVYQATVIAVEGEPVADRADVYARVAARPAGTPITYALERGLIRYEVTFASERFGPLDFALVLGSYLVTGVLWLLAGILGLYLTTDRRRGNALFLVGVTGGFFALTGAGLYGHEGGIRVHALMEALFPAALVHVAVVFSRVPAKAGDGLISMGWWVAATLALPYQLVLFQPGAYSTVHAACEAYMGLAGFGLVATLAFQFFTADRGTDSVFNGMLAGSCLGLGVPATIMVLSGLSGGSLPVNLVTSTAFLFPLFVLGGVFRSRRIGGLRFA